MATFLPTLSDKIKNYKKKCPFLFKQDPPVTLSYNDAELDNRALWKTSTEWQPSDLGYFKIKMVNVTNFKKFFNEEMPSYNDFNEQVKEYINCDDILHTDSLTKSSMDWSTVVKSSLARNVVKNLVMLSFYKKKLPVVDDLSHSLLQLFDYDADDRVIHYHKDILLKSSYMLEPRDPKVFIPNLSIETMREKYIKFVQENRIHYFNHLKLSFPDPYIHPEEIKFVTDSIAAFQHNSRMRRYYKKSETFKFEQWMPGIVMFKNRPMFLLMHMTEDLLHAVEKGKPPLNETVVKQYIVPPPEYYSPEKIKGLRDQRLHIASCYKAFRKFVM
ncbi:unnamed protein product [Cunninghamella echinulata]